MSKLHLVLLSAALVMSSLVAAQTTYRWIDKTTGKTVFSDQPPPPGTAKVQVMGGAAPSDDKQMPYATRQAVEKFPVTLYTSATCTEPCNQARSLLNGRGTPFTEKMLKSEAELAELTSKLGSEAMIPSVFVGQQSFKGFETTAWNNLLDLAGYPKTVPYGSKPSGAFAQ